MAGSMKDIKLRIKSVESTMQITKAMELVASSKMRRAKERVEHSRPYFETLHKTLTEIAAADPRARNPYLRRAEIKKTLLIVIAGDRGLAGGYNSNVLKQAQQEAGDVVVLPIGKRSAEYFVHHEVPLFTQEVLLAADITVGECFQLARRITEGYCKGEYDAANLLLHYLHRAFPYKTDEAQFGIERTLFAEEMYYYPYSDCEDRSILFARLVKDLLGLDVVLLYYPAHIAAAVCFKGEVKGDYMQIGAGRYVVCDPTYVGADVGDAMPDLKRVAAQVVKID